MKRQSVTPSSLTSQASNSARKGLQQYFTPEPWARALSYALPTLRRTVADLHCGDGSLLRGIANMTTREVAGLDLDPLATTGGPKTWQASHPALPMPLREMAHGDVLDFYPLAMEAELAFDLIVANPPFSLNWPAVHETLAQGPDGKITRTLDSTHATLRMLPNLLTQRGEALLIANQSTLQRLFREHPQDFSHAWLWAALPSFFPGVGAEIGALYLAKDHGQGPVTATITTTDPDAASYQMDKLRRDHFTADCVTHPWEVDGSTLRIFIAVAQEMERRRDPNASHANVTLDTEGNLRVWVSAFQEYSQSIEKRLMDFLRGIHRKHPLSLTLQRGTRMALKEMLDTGAWSIDPAARAAIEEALASFDRDRAPLSPVSEIQRIGWIDDAEELRCKKDFHVFRAGESYKLSTETIHWKKQEQRPRYHAGKRDLEAVSVKGTDLRLTLHHPQAAPVHFLFNPDVNGTRHTTYSLEDLALHFELPEVPDITSLHPERYAENLRMLDELEKQTP